MITTDNNSMETPRLAGDVEELSLLLPSGQILALAEAAESEGLTVAQFIRRLLAKALALASLTGRSAHSA